MEKQQTEAMEQMLHYILDNGRKDQTRFFKAEEDKLTLKRERELAKLTTEKKQQISKIKANVEQEQQQEIQREALRKKQQITLEKQHYLREITYNVQQKMQAWTKMEFLKLVSPIFTTNALSGEVEVKVARDSKNFITDILLEKFASEHGGEIRYRLSEGVIPDDGGFVLLQGGIEYNYLYSSILA